MLRTYQRATHEVSGLGRCRVPLTSCAALLFFAVTMVRADIPPPPVQGTNPTNARIGSAIERLQHSNVPVQVTYSATAAQIQMTLPSRHVEKARAAGLLDFNSEESAASASAFANYWLRNSIAGLALSAFVVAVGLILVRVASSTRIRIAIGAAAAALALLVLAVALLWTALTGMVMTSPGAHATPRMTPLGIEVTQVDEGNRVDFIVPEALRPERRNSRPEREGPGNTEKPGKN